MARTAGQFLAKGKIYNTNTYRQTPVKKDVESLPVNVGEG